MGPLYNYIAVIQHVKVYKYMIASYTHSQYLVTYAYSTFIFVIYWNNLLFNALSNFSVKNMEYLLA